MTQLRDCQACIPELFSICSRELKESTTPKTRSSLRVWLRVEEPVTGLPFAQWYIPPVFPAPTTASLPAGGLANATLAPDEDPFKATLLDDVAKRGF